MQSNVEASGLPASTVRQIIQADAHSPAPVTDIRDVQPDRFTTESCKKANWPYIPQECLTRGKPAVRILK